MEENRNKGFQSGQKIVVYVRWNWSIEGKHNHFNIHRQTRVVIGRYKNKPLVNRLPKELHNSKEE